MRCVHFTTRGHDTRVRATQHGKNLAT
jgi:hypothetical protein